MRHVQKLCFVMAMVPGLAAFGQVEPFTEGFDAGNANWADAAGAPTTWVPSGGPGGAGDGFVSATANYSGALEGDQLAIFRGEDAFDSSGDAFVGNWLEAGLDEFSFSIRHDFQTPLFFFGRFAGPMNFPGTVGLSFTPVMPNTWTDITILLDPNSPLIIPEGPPGTFEATFSNIGNLQIGLEVPAALAGFPMDVTFDLDNVSTVPAPAGLALLSMGVLLRRRRR